MEQVIEFRKGARHLVLMAAIDAQGGIGRDGVIPWDVPGDRRFFRAQTLGYPTLMGRKTFDSIGRPLPGRPAAVWSRHGRAPVHEDMIVHADLRVLLDWCFERHHVVYGIGGAQLYAALLPMATDLVLSRVAGHWQCDVAFPAFDGFDCVRQFDGDGFAVEHWVRRL